MTIAETHDLAFEAAFWGDCTNTYGEEMKQLVYARCMGLGNALSFDVGKRRIIDVGGGPASLLLKTTNLRAGLVTDPLAFPDWVIARYAIKGIAYRRIPGEALTETGWDEVWIYNVLQHVVDPERVLVNARHAAPLLRIFEWIDMPAYEGHPHSLNAPDLSRWLGGVVGGVHDFAGESGCVGTAFFGCFTR